MGKYARNALAALFLSALTLSFSGCNTDNTPAYSEYHYIGMGENITILLPESAAMAASECAREIAAHGNSLSASNPASDVCAINGEINHFITQDESLIQMLSLADTIKEITGGAFDCTYGALYDCW